MIYKKHKWEEWIDGYERCCQCGLLKEIFGFKNKKGDRYLTVQYRGYLNLRSVNPTTSIFDGTFDCDDFRLKENESGMDAGKIGNGEPQKNEGGTI